MSSQALQLILEAGGDSGKERDCSVRVPRGQPAATNLDLPRTPFRKTWEEASTERREPHAQLDETARALFESAVDEEFEDGMQSEFASRLQQFVENCGESAVEVVCSFVRKRFPNDEVVAEALGCLSRIKDCSTYGWRFYALTVGLKSLSVFLRDAATVGLARLRDPLALPYLQDALRAEPAPLLRKYMHRVISRLAEY